MLVMDLTLQTDPQASNDLCDKPMASTSLKPSAVRKRFLELSVLVHPDKNPSLHAKEVK